MREGFTFGRMVSFSSETIAIQSETVSFLSIQLKQYPSFCFIRMTGINIYTYIPIKIKLKPHKYTLGWKNIFTPGKILL